MNANLLVELLTEELPPKALRALGEAFAQGIVEGLFAYGLVKTTDPKGRNVFATPRRLAVRILDVAAGGQDRRETKKLMPAKVAFGTDGEPTAALRKRLEKEGYAADVNVNGIIECKMDGKEEFAFHTQVVSGKSLQEALQSAIENAIEELPIPKVMSYQLADGTTTVHFVRPAHGLMALHGDKIIDISILGLKAGRHTDGHRFQGVRNIEIATADAYEEALAAHGKVVADFAERRQQILNQLQQHATAQGGNLGATENYEPLLDEVTALVELPTVYVGSFEPEYLSVPQECLVLTMRANQKYFPLFDDGGKLTNRFLIVSNMRLAEPKNIVEGNQRVIRPRLADARFFFETDRKTRLEQRVPQLASIVYHNKLGSQLERTERVQILAGSIARAIGADPVLAERAAWLAKADLLTNMVGEFPELQGTMGRYYAFNDEEPPEVADAIEAHYRPRFAGDVPPVQPIAIALALADKLETLAGLFGIGQQPSGDKDPFALRRHALGVIRILVENKLDITLHNLVNSAFAAFPHGMLGGAHTDLQFFVLERLRSYLKDANYSTNEVESVLCMNPTRLDQIPHQLAAVRAFASLPEAASLAAANKRVANILKQAEAKGESYINAEAGMLKEPAEVALFDALKTASLQATPLFKQGDFEGYLKTFAVLKSPVDAFFDSVMVMVDIPELRHNRLALLADLREEMNRVADLSKLAA